MSARGRKHYTVNLASAFAELFSQGYLKGKYPHIKTHLDTAAGLIQDGGTIPDKWSDTINKRFQRIKAEIDQYKLNGPQMACFLLSIIDHAAQLPSGQSDHDRRASQRINLARATLFQWSKRSDWEITADDGRIANNARDVLIRGML